MSTRYVPAAGRAWLTPLFDPALALTMREERWRPIAARIAVEAGRDVADVGAGTGSTSLELARAGARVVAVDGDPAVLSIARRKAGADAIEWRLGLAGELPIETESVDAVVMTLLLHHLDGDGKRAALAEARRVLRPGGRLVIADWGAPDGLVQKAVFPTLRVLDGATGLAEHAAGRLPAVIAGGGFRAVSRRLRLPTVWGTLEVLSAARN